MKSLIPRSAFAMTWLVSSAAQADTEFGSAEYGKFETTGNLAVLMGTLIPIIFMVVVAVFLILKHYYQKQIYVAAIEKGMPIPEKHEGDPRKPALILIALGLGFAVVALVADHGLNTAIWAIVPMLVGVALWTYYRLMVRDREEAEETAAASQ